MKFSRFVGILNVSLLSLFLAPMAHTQPGVISTVAGTGPAGGFNGDGILATTARLFNPSGVFVDGSGNIFFADQSNQRVRKIDGVTGIISTVAGTGVFGFNGDGILATTALLKEPSGVFVDGSGNLFIADAGNHRVRKVDGVTGIISTVAGTGVNGFSGDGFLSTSARLKLPRGVFVDDSGNLFIADAGNHRVRKVDGVTGIISTVAGTSVSGFNGDGIPATTARLFNPLRVFVDGSGNIFIADFFNHRVRKVDGATGLISTVAGTGTAGFNGDGILATNARLNFPRGVFVDGSGNIFITDESNHRVRKIDGATGLISTVAGTGVNGFNGDGILATNARLTTPRDVFVDGSGNIFIADQGNQRVRKVGAVNQPPDCNGASISNQSADANCGATISGADVTGVTDPDGDPLTIMVSPTTLVLGANTVTVNADDGNGGTCSIDITVNVVGGTGTISGNVSVSSSGLEGVTVKLLEDANPINVIDDQLTDSNGDYSFTDVPVDVYQVMIVEPLGYTVDQNDVVTNLICGDNLTVDFVLTEIVLVNTARSKGYWKHQFDVDIKGRGNAQESATDLQSYLDEVSDRYKPHFSIFDDAIDGTDDFEDWQAILSVKGNAGMEAKATAQLAALVLNIMSLKVGQYEVVTADNKTAGDVMTYVSELIEDGDGSNDELAKGLAEAVNLQQTIAAGLVNPGQNILYKINSDLNFEIPESYALYQNHPNPFNPTTIIGFTLPESGFVTLSIYNSLGEEVAVLVNHQMAAGSFNIPFDASGFTSGIYLYRIIANNFVSVKKMILLK